MSSPTISEPDACFPPEDLIYRVTGVRDPDWFHRSGEMSVRDIKAALACVDRSLADFDQILDFGCGCGRILSWIRKSVPEERLCGVDIDREAIAWLRSSLPGVELHVSNPLPFLPFEPGRFDLVYCHSVFTHLDEDYQDAWLEELRRVTRPGAFLILSFHGNCALDGLEAQWIAAGADPLPLRHRLAATGTLFIEEDEWKNGPFPDFYHSMFHTEQYVYDRWGSHFRVRAHIPKGSLGFQDFVVLERSDLPHTINRPEPMPIPELPASTSPAGDAAPNTMAIPLPPLELRVLVGPTEDHSYDNPSGNPILPDLPPECYGAVFDFGCGCGRQARQLLQQRARPRRYLGIDIQKGLIDWCSENLGRIDDNFHFEHHDVYNSWLAPGNTRQSTAGFPAEDDQFSLVLAHSVFTHLQQHQTEFYLTEIARILAPGGVAYTTWFFFDREGFPMLQDHQVSLFVNAEDPSNAVIYDRKWFLSAVQSAGLVVQKTTPSVVPGFQWQVFLRHRRDGEVDHFPTEDCGADRICGARPAAKPSLTPPNSAQESETLLADNYELKMLVAELSLRLKRTGAA